MTTIALTWHLDVGGGWILLLAVGMALCAVCMLGFAWLARDGRAGSMCSWWRRPDEESGR